MSLEPDWRVVLKNEFHDILPGSSIREVYEDAANELGEAIAHGKAKQDEALAAIAGLLPKGTVADAVIVVNTSLDARPLRLEGIASDDVVAPLSVTVLDRAALAPMSGLGVTRDDSRMPIWCHPRRRRERSEPHPQSERA